MRPPKSQKKSMLRIFASMDCHLLLDKGSWINGQVISIDGGTTMR